MDDYLRAVVLGLVQATTEFLPVSSSGHLVVAPRIIGDEVSSLTFDVGLHIGTTVAVVSYFWRDWFLIGLSGLRDVGEHRWRISRWQDPSRLGLWLVVGTIPAAVAGLLLGDVIEQELREPWIVGATLVLFSGVIWALDTWGGTLGQLGNMTGGRALTIGAAQALALVPGVSRSGATIATGRGLGFGRGAAARFSFLLSAPIVLGAGVLKVTEALSSDEVVQWGPFIVGAAVAAVAGALVIHVFLGFVERHTLRVFIGYRVVAGLAILGAVAAGWL